MITTSSKLLSIIYLESETLQSAKAWNIIIIIGRDLVVAINRDLYSVSEHSHVGRPAPPCAIIGVRARNTVMPAMLLARFSKSRDFERVL